MKKAMFVALVLSLVLVVTVFRPAPVGGASKEIEQLQKDVALLQQQVSDLQQTVVRENAVLKTLIEQSADSVNRMGTVIREVEKSVQAAMANANTRVDGLATQVQSVRDALDEMGARFGRVSQQLAETQSVMQSVDARLASSGAAPPAAAEPISRPAARPSQPVTSTPAAGGSVPSADALYNSALRDFTSGNYELAGQQFNDYLRFYRQSELAGNAQYYLGEIEYQQKNYQSAIQNYDKVLQEFPGSFKTAASYLKKSYALLELNRQREAIALLRLVVEKFPRWDEANLARSRLRRLGETVPE